MIDVHLVVQGQRVVAVAPIVPDTFSTVDDERIDIPLSEASGDRQSGLAAADDQHRRIPVGVGGVGQSSVEPVGSAEIARVHLAGRPRGADGFLETIDAVERGHQRPCPRCPLIVFITDQANHATPRTTCGLEAEDGFHRFPSGPGDDAGRRTMKICVEPRRLGARRVSFQRVNDIAGAADGLNVPGEGQQVAPMAVLVDQPGEGIEIGPRDRLLEIGEPTVHRRQQGFFHSIQHARSLDGLRAYCIRARGRGRLLFGPCAKRARAKASKNSRAFDDTAMCG